MSSLSVGLSRLFSSVRSRRVMPYLLLPFAVLSIVSFVAFRQMVLFSPPHTLSTPLVVPAGWPQPPVPANNPITQEKFALGRQLFYETALSGDGKTSCSSCHDVYASFASANSQGIGSHSGAFGVQSTPARDVPRLMNVAYDTILTWDGHIATLEDQVEIAVQKKGDLQGDTNVVFANLAANPVYGIMFTQAFGDPTITLQRIAMAVATFERCLISANSPYDQYVNGDTTAMDASSIRGMNLFFDTTKTNCSECHNNLGAKASMVSANIFTDNNYYRTGTFESTIPGVPNGGYGFDTTADTNNLRESEDPGRAGVTGDSSDIGKFRTPSLRNVCLHAPYGADGTVASIGQVIQNYNNGGNAERGDNVTNQDPRIKQLGLSTAQTTDLESFLNSLTDVTFISNPAFNDPGAPAVVEDGYVIAGNLSAYPNPASGTVNIECPDFTGSTDATLVSASGTTVWHQTLNSEGKLRLDLSGIANGSYRLVLRSGNAQQTIPIALQR